MKPGCRNLAELPLEFKEFFIKAQKENAVQAGENENSCVTAEEIVANPLMAEFVIGNGTRGIGMCVISSTGKKPEVSYFYIEESFRGKGIEEDIKKTLDEMNK